MDKIMNNPRLEHIMNQMFGCLDSEMLEICCQVSEDVKNVQKDFLSRAIVWPSKSMAEKSVQQTRLLLDLGEDTKEPTDTYLPVFFSVQLDDGTSLSLLNRGLTLVLYSLRPDTNRFDMMQNLIFPVPKSTKQ